MRHLIPFVLLFAASSVSASDTSDLITAAMENPIRTEAEIARDDNRKPVQTLEYFGLTPDMRVLELLPGGGWYTKLLGPVLADKGKLYVALGARRVIENLLSEDGYTSVEALEVETDFDRDGPFRTNNVGPFELGVSDLDMVLTFRNMHNFTPEGRANINKAVFSSLKSGGVYGVVDHTARHMEPMTAENRRRLDPIIVIKELTTLGFIFDGYSDLHYKSDDELRYEVGRKSVSGNSDRFTLRFKKP